MSDVPPTAEDFTRALPRPAEAPPQGQAALPEPPRPGAKRPPRLSVVESVYLQSPDEGTTEPSRPARFGRWLCTSEEPCSRRLRAGAAWGPLARAGDLWLERASLVRVENLTRSPLEKGGLPTGADREEWRAACLEVGVLVAQAEAETMRDEGAGPVVRPLFLFPPGEVHRFTPVDLAALLVRCPAGECVYRLTLYPE